VKGRRICKEAAPATDAATFRTISTAGMVSTEGR
jgi:hypothetical protein